MDSTQARQLVEGMRERNEDGEVIPVWVDDTTIATDTFRNGVIANLSRDPELQDDGDIALVELSLTESLPDVDQFEGIFAVDEIGIWYYDGDGHVADAVWRQRVIPWRYVESITLHQIS